MSSVKISNFPVPFALPVAASINGTETLPVDQTVGGVVTTVSSTFARLLGPISITSYTNGGVGIAAAASGVSLTVNGTINGADIQDWKDGTNTVSMFTATGVAAFGTVTNTALQLWANNASRVVISTGGLVTMNQPSSGTTLLINTLDTGVSGVNVHDIAAVNGTNIKFSDTVGDRGYIGYGPAGFTAGVALTEFGLSSAVGGSLRFAVNGGGTPVLTISSAGVATFTTTGAPGLILTQAGATRFSVIDSTNSITNAFGTVAGTGCFLGPQTNHPLAIRSNNIDRITVAIDGQVSIVAPSAGQPLNLTGRGATVAGLSLTTMASTGAAVPTLAANKPGASTSTASWIVVLVDGATRYIPCWA